MATPSEPSAASPTTSMSGCRSKKIRRPVRTTEWSSTISTRMLVRLGHGRSRRAALAVVAPAVGEPGRV